MDRDDTPRRILVAMSTAIIGLPQLAVLAKILCLLMVVMCGAVPAMVRSVSLYSTCSSGNITVTHRSIVAVGRTEHNAPFQMLTTQSEDFTKRLYIRAEKSGRYICFSKSGKIVTRRQKGPMCQFYELYNGSYLRYRSVMNESLYLGFNKNGKPVRNRHARQECFNFIKYNPHADIDHHNSVLNTGAKAKTLSVKEQRKMHSKKPSEKVRPKKFQPEAEPRSMNTKGNMHKRLRHSGTKTKRQNEANRSNSTRRSRPERTVPTIVAATDY